MKRERGEGKNGRVGGRGRERGVGENGKGGRERARREGWIEGRMEEGERGAHREGHIERGT